MPQLDIFLENLKISVGMFIPEFILTATFILAILFDLIFKKSRNISGYITILGFIVTGIFLYLQLGTNYRAFSDLLVIDDFGNFFKFLILITSILVVIMSMFSKELYTEHRRLGEYYSMIAGMTFGMFLLCGSSNLIMIYLAIETMSISSYILAGYTKEVKRASEASLKYVIFGAISSGIMIFGISLIFGLTGHLNLFEINKFLASQDVNVFALFVSSLMIVAGFGYKISAVPFHFWTPDVYEGAPITITAYLSVASKAAGFAVLLRFLKVGFIDSIPGTDNIWTTLSGIDWNFVIAVLSVLTMTLGNLVAVWQTNLKRLLAYSSIAHAGYLLMGVAVLDNSGAAAVLIYFFVYMLMNLGAFYVVMLIANKIGSEDIEDYNGLGYRAPVLSVCMTLFLISLTGLPPTAGFIGKLFIFSAVINAGYLWLAVIGVLNSVVSLYYYVKIFKNMYLKDVESQKPALEYTAPSLVLLMIFAIPTLIFGIFYSPIVDWANNSVHIFLGN